MPTCSWIREKDIEAFYAAVETVPQPGGTPPPVWRCPFCPAYFPQPEGFQTHLEAEHSGRRPFMTIGGFEPNSTDIIRKRIDADGLKIFDTTGVYISEDNFHFIETTRATLARKLASIKEGRVWIKLKNQFDAKAEAIYAQYDFSFRVYDDEVALERVDKAFVKLLGKEQVTMDDVDAFIRQTEHLSVSEYRTAMAEYVIGVLVKDGDTATGIRVVSRNYSARYEGALGVLQEFARPLPRLICGLIRFSRNDFALGHLVETRFGLLDRANAQLSPLARKGGAWSAFSADEGGGVQKFSICPVDNGSAAILFRAAQLGAISRWSQTLEAQLMAEADVSDLDPEDRQKLFALWAAAAIRLDKQESALSPLRNLAGSYCFGQWADALLEEIEG